MHLISKVTPKTVKRKKKHLNLILTQSSGFDVLAALSIGLSRHGVRHRFVIPFPPGPLQGTSKEAHEFLNAYGLKSKLFWDFSKWWKRFFMHRIIRDSIANVVQTPYLTEHFSPTFLTMLRKSKNMAYTNYGVNLANTPNYHFELETYSEFEKIFVSSETDLKEFKSAGIPDERLVLIGNPLTFEVMLGEKSRPTKEKGETISILWAPHWDSSWSNWEVTLPLVQELLRVDSRIQITFRPHPLLMPGIKGDLPDGYQVARPLNNSSTQLLEKFIIQDRVQFSKSSLISDIQTNDLLLTDGVSIVGFWAATGKPIGIFRRPDSPRFSSQISPIEKSIDFIYEPFTSLKAWVTIKNNQTHKLLEGRLTHELVFENEIPIEPAKLLTKAYQ